jgi:DNA-binding transcriptional ArsR family regulator
MTTMVSGNTLAEVAALIGDPARANILSALMDGRALTAGELAWHAGVSAQTTSGRLAKLAAANLLAVERQGRHRYHRLASPELAHAIESLMAVAVAGPKRHRPTGPRDEALRAARTCYDHLAGRVGVAFAGALERRGVVERVNGDYALGVRAAEELAALGIDLEPLSAQRRPLVRGCLDWSERDLHVAGSLGAALTARLFELGCIVRRDATRSVAVTERGGELFTELALGG